MRRFDGAAGDSGSQGGQPVLICRRAHTREANDAPTPGLRLRQAPRHVQVMANDAMASDATANDVRGGARGPCLDEAELSGRVLRLGAGQKLVVVGLGGDGVAQAIAAEGDPTRCALILDTGGPRTGAACLDRLLDDLARLALDRWPDWHGEEAGEAGACDRPRDPSVSAAWFRAATRCARAGRPPRFRHAARDLEFRQLMQAIDPSGVVLVADIDPCAAARAAPVIEALEWCCGHGGAAVLALPAWPAASAPYDRILYGAREILREPVPVAARFLAPRSRAHPASAVERRMEAALRGDAELSGLFSCNEPVPVAGWGQPPRVDLLCRAHRVVVELDGPEHRGAAKYGDDRHRDYTLMAAGYLVLRLTNEQVEADLERAVEKIRTVVRLRSHPAASP